MGNLIVGRTGIKLFPSSKFRIPRLPSPCCALDALCELVERSLEKNALVLVAPAGCGKTTLLAQWAASASSCEVPISTKVAWVRLDAGDNECARFCEVLIAGLEVLVPHLGQLFDEVVESGQSDTFSHALNVALERGTQTDDSTRHVLVLDNFECIDDEDIDEVLDSFVRYLPAAVRLIISTQRAPSFPAARGVPDADEAVSFIASGQLVLDEDATARYVRSALGAGTCVPEEVGAAVWCVTGGHLPALNQAVSYLTEQNDAVDGLVNTSFDARPILDAVFSLLSEPEKAVLVRTSFLDIVTPSLCDHVLQVSGSDEVIATIVAKTGALTPVSGKRGWYENNDPWPQYLQAKFRKLERSTLDTLCKRASVYLKEHDYIGQAMDCLRKAALWEELNELVGEYHLSLMFDNRFDVFKEALEKVPRHILESSPKLSIAEAWVFVKAGSVEEALRCARIARSLVDEEDPDALQMETECLVLQSMCCGHSGDIQVGKGLIDKLLQRNQEDPGFFLSLVYNAAGCIVAREKEPDRVIGYLKNCVEVAESQGNKPACSVLCYFAARQCIDAGDLRRAEETARSARGYVGFQVGGGVEFNALPDVIAATVARKRGDFEQAERLYRASLEVLKPTSGVEFFSEAACGLALTQHAQGRTEEALQTTRSVLQLCDKYHAERPKLVVLVYLALIELDAGRLNEVEGHVRMLRAADPASADLVNDLIAFVLVRFRFVKGQLEEARKLIEALEESLERSHRNGLLLSALVTKALVAHVAGQQGPATQTLLQALSLGCETGEIEAFVNEGATMARVLAEVRERNLLDREQESFAHKIVQRIADLNIPEPAWRLETPSKSPLTAREREVCELLALGYSNRDIAESLCVSVNTVDTHRKRIYTKLAVSSRKELVEKLSS